MKDQTILADCTALVDVTEDMRKLRVCPECLNNNPMNFSIKPFSNRVTWSECPTCKGTGLNPDMTAWWEALEKAPKQSILSRVSQGYNLWEMVNERNKIQWVYFIEYPVEYCSPPFHPCTKIKDKYNTHIHRLENDLRPWPECLDQLIFDWVAEQNSTGPHDVGDSSFAIATPETAPVFKRFGIETLVRA